jgi:hypothetical protein
VGSREGLRTGRSHPSLEGFLEGEMGRRGWTQHMLALCPLPPTWGPRQKPTTLGLSFPSQMGWVSRPGVVLIIVVAVVLWDSFLSPHTPVALWSNRSKKRFKSQEGHPLVPVWGQRAVRTHRDPGAMRKWQ